MLCQLQTFYTGYSHMVDISIYLHDTFIEYVMLYYTIWIQVFYLFAHLALMFLSGQIYVKVFYKMHKPDKMTGKVL